MLARINTEPLANALADVVAVLLMRRNDSEEIVDRLATGGANLRVMIDAMSGTLSLILVSAEGDKSLLDTLIIRPGPDAGISVDEWMLVQLQGQPTH